MSDNEKAVEETKKRELEEEEARVSSLKKETKKAKTEAAVTPKEETDTKTADKTDTRAAGETETKPEKPKYVFGSSTGFGQMSGFKMFGSSTAFSFDKNSEKKSEDAEEKKQETPTGEETKSPETEKKTTAPTFGSSAVFGSGSTFGNAFQDSLNKKSIFDSPVKEDKPAAGDDDKEGGKKQEKKEATADGEEEREDNEDAHDDNDSNKEDTEQPDVYQKVHLEKQEIKSGEENETTIFQAKAKLYYMELAKANDGWKERGIGLIKINKYNESPSELYTSRLIMRQEGNYKLILNLPLIESFNIVKGMPSSLHAEKFLRIQTVDGKEPIQYALKLQVDNVNKLYDSIQSNIFKSK